MTDVRVAALVGSLRDDSYTRLACEEALDAAGEFDGVETDCIDLRTFDLPVYDADEDGAGDAEVLRERVTAADSVILGTPVYHASYSSALKNALDYCGFDEFDETTVGLLCVAGGSFPTTTLDHLRSVGRSVNAWVVPHQVALPRVKNAFEDGVLTDDDARKRIHTLGRRMVEYANIEPDPRTMEAEQNVGADD
ncbi:NAD(P)H-dependent oxidoreductase [Natronomonas gomsonensis]|jgi:NAD(P)H-dependent FMN reductase|uniref:NADPH-dependent FMN reductase n=1 Tax=Natronomonas gomsonensis TaxID=1046043 RepID=UPI0020CA6484|nr:NAD(P)H-dependent oxidoreductase [Natronomonas gomsonensis]MCY4729258.1 NAD(P)H-dependent oxidoreductase [Natronomonas gomsonensis]